MFQSLHTTSAKCIFYIFHPMCVTIGIIIIYDVSQIPNDYNASLCTIFFKQHHSHSRWQVYTIFVVGVFMMPKHLKSTLKYINISCVQYNISYLPLWLYFELNCENERVRDTWNGTTTFSNYTHTQPQLMDHRSYGNGFSCTGHGCHGVSTWANDLW